MNYLDIILGIPLLWLTWRGFRNGLVIELAKLAGLILGIWVAFHFSAWTGKTLAAWIHVSPVLLPLLAFILTFLAVLILVWFIGKLAEHLVDMVSLGFLNKLAGAVLGMLKAVLLLGVILLVFNHYENTKLIVPQKAREESFLYKSISGAGKMIYPLVKTQFLDGKKQDPARNP